MIQLTLLSRLTSRIFLVLRGVGTLSGLALLKCTTMKSLCFKIFKTFFLMPAILCHAFFIPKCSPTRQLQVWPLLPQLQPQGQENRGQIGRYPCKEQQGVPRPRLPQPYAFERKQNLSLFWKPRHSPCKCCCYFLSLNGKVATISCLQKRAFCQIT